MELDRIGIEQLEQHIVGALAVHFRQLEVFVVKALLNPRGCGLFSEAVVFIGGALHVIHGGMARPTKGRYEHLRQAEVFRPGNSAILIFP